MMQALETPWLAILISWLAVMTTVAPLVLGVLGVWYLRRIAVAIERTASGPHSPADTQGRYTADPSIRPTPDSTTR